jgi:hypothetical protein
MCVIFPFERFSRCLDLMFKVMITTSHRLEGVSSMKGWKDWGLDGMGFNIDGFVLAR